MSNKSNALWGFLSGLAIGAVAGILFAPDKGVNTRKSIKKQVKKTGEILGKSVDNMKDKIDDLIDNTKQKVSDFRSKNKIENED